MEARMTVRTHTKREAKNTYRGTYRDFLDREKRARQIVAGGGVHPTEWEAVYLVDSQNGSGQYRVNVYNGTCTCPDRQYRGAYCKHQHAAEIVAAREIDRDPMAPDYEALAEDAPATAWGDSREAAGMPSGRPITTGYTYRRHLTREEACEYADYKLDSWL